MTSRSAAAVTPRVAARYEVQPTLGGRERRPAPEGGLHQCLGSPLRSVLKRFAKPGPLEHVPDSLPAGRRLHDRRYAKRTASAQKRDRDLPVVDMSLCSFDPRRLGQRLVGAVPLLPIASMT